MASPLYAEEATQHDGQPRELYRFILTGGDQAEYRYTDYDIDLTVAALLYTSTPAIERDALSLTPVGNENAVEVRFPLSLAISNDIVKKPPPRLVQLILNRYHVNTANVSTLFNGYLTHAGAHGRVGYARFETRFSLAMKDHVPAAFIQTSCNHILGDAMCAVDIEVLKVATTVSAIDADNPAVVTLAGDGLNPDQWARGGHLKRVSDGEMRTIIDHTGLVMTLLAPFRNLAVSNPVELFPGCDLTFTTCLSKFNNRINFGGFPKIKIEELIKYGVRGSGK